jgi:hypothetical protein
MLYDIEFLTDDAGRRVAAFDDSLGQVAMLLRKWPASLLYPLPSLCFSRRLQISGIPSNESNLSEEQTRTPPNN